jgi:hypothetical protein
MSRLSIEITPEQHQCLKAVAALSGKSIKDYVLDRLLPTFSDDAKALHELEQFLQPRIAAAKRGSVSKKSVKQIFDEVRKKH